MDPISDMLVRIKNATDAKKESVVFPVSKLKLAIAEEGISDTRIAEIAEKDGMVTMMQDGILKALTGITSLEEVFRVTKE